MLEILFLLLPLAFYSGWKTASKKKKDYQIRSTEVSARFVRGINFLLNEDPDKALDIFLESPAIDSQTADTFLALGKMFRNRGEVNRALRVHQHLVARPDLDNSQRQTAMLALGEDFFAAGMLDRAESVFREIMRNYPKNTLACEPLRHIYEQLQDWDKAIELASCSIDEKSARNRLVAHYLCEQAEECLHKNQLFQMDEKLKRASAAFPGSARGERSSALKHFQQAIQHEQRLLGTLTRRLLEVFPQPAELNQIQAFVNREYQQKKDNRLFPAMLNIAKASGQQQEMLPLIHQHLQNEPSSLPTIARATELLTEQEEGQQRLPLHSVSLALNRLLLSQPRFQCSQCGYRLHEYLWRCPACHQWDTIQNT